MCGVVVSASKAFHRQCLHDNEHKVEDKQRTPSVYLYRAHKLCTVCVVLFASLLQHSVLETTYTFWEANTVIYFLLELGGALCCIIISRSIWTPFHMQYRLAHEE